MNDAARSKAELLAEVGRLRQRVTELESSTRMMRQAMDALRETDGSYRLVVEEFPQGIVIVKDGPPRVIYANEAAAAILGQSVEDILKLPARVWLDFVHDEDREQVAACFEAGIAGMREPVTTAFRMIRPDGEIRLVELAANRLHTKGRDTVHATFADVTDLDGPSTLAEDPSYLERVFEVAPCACYFTDLDGVFVDSNPATEELTGYPREELVGKGFGDLDLLSSDGLERLGKLLQRNRKGRPAGPAEFVLRKRDGSGVAVAISTQPVDANGTTRVLAIAADVSAERKAREALSGQQERFELLLNTVFDGISICEYDPRTRAKQLLYCNDRFVEMSGYSRAQLEQCADLNELFDHHLTPEEMDEYHELIVAGKPYRGTSSWKRPDGADNIHEYSAVSIPVGDKFHLMGVDRDITEQVRSREALEESEERFRLLVENAFDGINICRYDPETGDHKLVFCNERYAEMAGRNVEELMAAESLDEFSVPTLSEEESRASMEALKRGEPFRGIGSWDRPDGKQNVHEFIGVPVAIEGEWHVIGIDRDITEQRAAEQELRRSEELFRLLVDNAFDGINICELDAETSARRLVFCNERFVEMSGYSREELEACPDLDQLMDPRMTEGEHQERYERLLAGEPVRGISSWRRPDGKTNQHEYSAALIERDGKPHIVGIDRDVTEAKESERALRQSEERFRHVVERAFDGISICEWDPEAATRRLLFCNDRYVEMSGYTRDELMSCANLDDLIELDPSTIAHRDEHLAALLAGEPVTGVASWIRPDGEENIYEFSSFSMPAGEGKYHIIGVDRDITERIRVEDALRAGEERFRRLFEQSNDAVIIHEVNGAILDVNERACALFAYDREELVTMGIAGLLAPESREEAAGILKDMEREEGVFVEIQAVTADGRAIEVELSGSKVDEGRLQSIVRDITERKRAEEALRQSEERFRLLVDTAFDGINICDYDPGTGLRRLIFCNDRFVAMSGYSREELMACSDLDQLTTVHWTAEEEDEQLARKEQGLPFFGLSSWNRPDGEENYYEWSAVLVRVGEQHRLFGVDRDITDRVKAENALRESEQRFRMLVDTAFDGINICEVDPDTMQRRLVFCNDRFVEMSGYSREELLEADDIRDLNRTEETPEQRRERSERLVSGRPVRGVAHWKRPDGRENTYEFSSIAVEMGGKLYAMGVDRDVTERRKAEEDLRRSEERFRSLVETAFDGISITAFNPETDERTLIFCNSRFVEMSGYSREELEECANLNDLVDPQVSEEQREKNRELLRSGKPFRTTISWRRPDGAENFIECSSVALEVGDIYHLVSVDRDVTVRITAEEERRALEEQMRQAQKLESLGVLAGGIAHDFNNLLTGVLGNAGLALSELSPESPARYSVEQIQLSAQHAAELCRQMLAYSGRGQFVVQPLHISRLIREIGHLVDAALSGRAVLEYNLEDDLPPVEGDATQLRQVVMNLLTNAAEAIGDRSGLLVVRTGMREVGEDYLSDALLGEDLEEGEYVFIEVTDTGAGMDEETQARIFEPFFTTKFTGRGLGLAAVLGIVRGHGGAIRVESAPGQGTTFEVILPPTTQTPVVSERSRSREGEPTEWRGKGTVLVVDDEEVVRMVSRRALERVGFDVLTAADGKEGVDLFREHADEISLVLLDLTMPRMSGEDAFRNMKEIREDVKAILLSGYTQDDADGQFAGEGMAAFVQKPYDPATLVRSVRDVLEN